MSLETYFESLKDDRDTADFRQSMKYEALRLASFDKRPSKYHTSASELANAGFYYTGKDDFVACFKCNLTIGNWDRYGHDVDPLVEHFRRSENCPFLQDMNRENVPFTECSNYIHTNSGFDTQTASASPTMSAHQNESEKHTSEINSCAEFESDSIECLLKYKDEQMRLKSYQYWPRSARMRPEELACAGFYYLGKDDRVQCAFCKGVLRNWEYYDDAMMEHKKHFATCPFIVDPISAGNVPIRRHHVKGVHIRHGHSDYTAESDLGIISERPRHPHMATLVDRINSFELFFSESSHKPEDFAEAGFFSTGHGDNVKCFFCDGGLRNWERNDDPWVEHARWFPKCGYLRTKKGDEFINRMTRNHSLPGVKKPKLRKLKRKFEVTEEKLSTAMDSEVAKEAASMGFDEEQIRSAVESRLGELGNEFPSLESLVDVIYELQAIKDKGIIVEEEENETEPVKDLRKKDNKAKMNDTHKSDPEEISLMPDVKAEKLADEVERLKDQRLCKVCMDKEMNIVFLKCGHLMCCTDCAPAFSHCPLCRQIIRGTICADLQ